jgi:hypothetical protein
MICDQCYYRSDCEEIPDQNGRCSNYLKDGDISCSDDFIINPTDTMEYDYDVIKKVLNATSKENLLSLQTGNK